MSDINNMHTYREYQEEAHRNAVAHGWHDQVVHLGQAVLLMHCEISEACEEYRAGRRIDEIYFRQSGIDADPTKPEGFPVELADVVIRIMDYCGLVGFDMVQFIKEKTYVGHYLEYRGDPTFLEIQAGVCAADCPEPMDIVGTLLMLHQQLSGVQCTSDLCRAVLHIMGYCHQHEIPLDDAMRMKLTFNRTRPHRHGGKKI